MGLGRAWQGLKKVGRAKQGLAELNEAQHRAKWGLVGLSRLQGYVGLGGAKRALIC